ncbi:NAD-dependent epimerase/dehydratase family protein [Actinoplanes sp. G11-F43]|uniref:NAD-dependent epimerase/dehydratase family protein n=1 Tax=Actinoplanes sp. G11-F43 TaxID=3424130 RepID=UPI003D32DE9D
MTAPALAIVGCGAVTELCHLPALLLPDPPFRVAALVDRDPARTALIADALGYPVATFTDVRELPGPRPGAGSRRPGAVPSLPGASVPRIDAALVATGPGSQTTVAGILAAAGIPVLLEKPVALTASDLGPLLASGVPVIPAHVRRFYPATPWVAQLLASGRLGRLLRVRWREGAAYAWPAAGPSAFAPGPGGGVLADLGPHVLDLLGCWLGGPAELLSHRDNTGPGRLHAESGFDQNVRGAASEVELRLAVGAVTAEVTLSRLRALANQIVLEGTDATLTIGTERAAGYEISGPAPSRGRIPATDPALLTRAGLFRHQLVRFARTIHGPPSPATEVPVAATLGEAAATVDLIARCRPAGGLPRPWEPSRRTSTARSGSPSGGRVAVTGAGGFIGGHVVEYLLDSGVPEVVAVVRTHARRARLAHRAPDRLRFVTADIRDAGALTAAFRGCDAVVHTVYGSHGEPGERWTVTVDGTAAVLAAAAQAGVRRLVHLSSAAVYRAGTGPALTEDSPPLVPEPGDLSYAAQKAAADTLVTEGGPGGVEVVRLQPAAVYGPMGPVWTIRPLRRLREDNACLPGGGGGTCDVVHVHDVASAVAHLLTAPAVAGSRFLLTGPETTSWGDYYDRYRDLLGLPRLDLPDSPAWADRDRELFGRRTTVDASRLAGTGFRPRIGLDEGMASVSGWASWAGLT